MSESTPELPPTEVEILEPDTPGGLPTDPAPPRTSSKGLGGKAALLCEFDMKTGNKCKRFAKKPTRYCELHIDLISIEEKGMEHLSVALNGEIRALKSFLNKLTKNAKDPKVLNKVNDLIVSVTKLDEKIKGLVTREQFKQVGFYFSSILFKYIENGTRYELARQDFLPWSASHNAT